MTQHDLLGNPETKITGKLTDGEITLLEDAQKCDSTEFRNYYESRIDGGVTNPDVVKTLNMGLAKNRELPTSGASDIQIRIVISGLQEILKSKLTLKGDDLAEVSGQFTPDLVSALDNFPKPAQ
jgi:hypothetical protein